MKRFTILLTALISVLVFSAIFQVWSDARAEAKKASAPVQVYDATGAMLEAISPDKNVTFSPVYDATFAMYDATVARLEAISPDKNVTFSPVYDATFAMYDATVARLEATNPKEVEETPPLVYDATGAMLEAINP
jgi:hypothetical protein